MVCSSLSCPDLEALRDLVNATLCDHEELEVDAFPLTETRLHARAGRVASSFVCMVLAASATRRSGKPSRTRFFFTARPESVSRPSN